MFIIMKKILNKRIVWFCCGSFFLFIYCEILVKKNVFDIVVEVICLLFYFKLLNRGEILFD